VEPALVVLAMLAEVYPGSRAADLSEIDEILAFAGDLGSSHDDAVALLQPAVTTLPLPWLVDRYVAALAQRQRVIADQLAQGHALDEVGQLHDVARTAQRIAAALARAGRVARIAAQLA